MGMGEWKSRDKANAGARMDVRAPDGKQHGDWMQVRHVWSDAFKQAEDKASREAAEAMMGDAPDVDKAAAMQRECRLDVLTALVSGWSDEAECTPASVRELLENEPGIADQLDKFAVDRTRFFGVGLPEPRRGSKAKSA